MTPADIVAEALAVGLQYTTHDGLKYDDSGKLRPPRHLLVEPDGVRVVDTSSDRDEVLAMAEDHADCSAYYRDDVVDAALAHLVARVADAEGRAKTAEAALDAVARQGWRACVLLAAARMKTEADSIFAEADEAHDQDEDAVGDRLVREAMGCLDEAQRLRECVTADAGEEAPVAERHVLVTVKIATEGRRCRDWNDAEACPYLCSEWATCQLFRADLEREEREYEAHSYLRAPACLELDADGAGGGGSDA